MIQYTEINRDQDIAGIKMCVEYKCGKFQCICICIIKTKVFIRQKGTNVIMMDRQQLIQVPMKYLTLKYDNNHENYCCFTVDLL